MTRARASALVLVNWKGVFYERYLLDRNVTSLEGANGAGKTTVMIAAYVVLLPDMSRLRFTNLGETAGTGGDRGIWGRLGEPGRPSYAAMELTLPGDERLIIGVHLERKTEPSLEPRAFFVSGLRAGTPLSDLFLIKHQEEDAIPELKELSENASRLGAQMEIFRSTKEYFSELFERGIFALRLANEDDRSKFNEMLRTSMTGGISRALTSELRGFLLREETGLSDALSRMRANLDTCRRTRAEVVEAQKLEGEISGVHRAAQAMLRAAFSAARAELAELAELAGNRESERDGARDEVDRLAAELEETTEKQRRAAENAARARELAAHVRAALERAGRAREISARVAALREEKASLDARTAAAAQAREGSGAAREAARSRRAWAQEALARAAAGLARHEAGLDELHRRAHAYRTARESLERARALLGDPEFLPDAAPQRIAATGARLEELDRERARRARELETAAARRSEFELAFSALSSLVASAERGGAFALARAELGRLLELDALVAEIPGLEREAGEHARLSARRAALVERGRELDLEFDPHDTVGALTSSWQGVEQRAAELDASVRADEQRIARAREQERGLQQRLRVLESLAARSREHSEQLARISTALGEPLVDGASLLRAKDRLVQRREALRRRIDEAAQERERALALAARLEAPRGAVAPELLTIADEVDAELALSRFEDLEPEAAARTEAALGSLRDALVVEDPARAARSVAGQQRGVDELWFVAPEQLLAAAETSGLEIGPDLVHEWPGMVRVIRKPEAPRLGRRARAAKSHELRARAAELAAGGESDALSLLELDRILRDVERAANSAESDEPLDVTAELAACRTGLQTARDEIAAGERRVQFGRSALSEARERAVALRALLGDAHRLALPAGARSELDVRERLERARLARTELESATPHRRVLNDLLDTLRVPPPSEDSLRRFQAEHAELEAERDRLFLALKALEALVENAAAIGFDGAERALDTEVAIAPALQEQHEQSLAALREAEEALDSAERDWEAATRTAQQVEAEALATDALIAREEQALAELSAGTDPELERIVGVEELSALEARIDAYGQEERTAAARTALLAERAEHARSRLAELAQEAERARERSKPLESGWAALCSRVEQGGGSLLADPAGSLVARTSSEWWAEARGKRELLLDRLARARAGSEVVQALKNRPQNESVSQVEARLADWQIVRDWLSRCLPSPVAGAEDPVVALESLRRNLVVLEDRLTRQESDLRGTSEDVARSIDVQIRRAQSQVRRLNQHLEGVRFGSIHAIRVRMGRVERMDQILGALREGATQELLFQPGMPIEEALNEIFRRHAGGKSGGQRLLDYREYLEVGVEIARREDAKFEPANPARLSTGEAIGVGAALMMTVLTEWERDANLLRGKRGVSSLRVLFLDEANRLSQDNLAVLFDLCQALDLQLLIAAPEVARADGNTTYRLVRRTDEDGREEVIVSGRRGLTATFKPEG